MGVVADAALKAGGEVYGVIPRALVDREIAHTGLTELFVVADMHERKARMADLADGFIALPGGAGTLEELFEVWTWAQLGLHTKPLGLLDVDGFYEPLATMLDHMVEEGFLSAAKRPGGARGRPAQPAEPPDATLTVGWQGLVLTSPWSRSRRLR